MTIDDLERELNKPLFVFKMARADNRVNSGARTRALNARKEIHELVMKYAIEQGAKFGGP